MLAGLEIFALLMISFLFIAGVAAASIAVLAFMDDWIVKSHWPVGLQIFVTMFAVMVVIAACFGIAGAVLDSIGVVFNHNS